MQVPLTVSFQGMPVDESIRSACWTESEKLERFYDRITSCHVTVSLPQRRRHGNHFDLHVRLAVPGGEVVVSHKAPEHRAAEQPQLLVREAFDEVRRQLQDHVRRLRGDTKHHERPARQGERGTGAAGEPPDDWKDQPE